MVNGCLGSWIKCKCGLRSNASVRLAGLFIRLAELFVLLQPPSPLSPPLSPPPQHLISLQPVAILALRSTATLPSISRVPLKHIYIFFPVKMRSS